MMLIDRLDRSARCETVRRSILLALFAAACHTTICNGQASSAEATQAAAFRTRHASFQTASFSALPGWSEDRVGEALHAFMESCKAIGKRPAWQGACTRARTVNARNEREVREFFEREFAPYHIRELDQSPAGIITGYFEPLLNGSATPVAPFIHPVYAVPSDLLLLDARRLPANARARPVTARIEGNEVIPVAEGASITGRTYALEVGNTMPITADRKLRLRLEGDRIVPYPPRSVIESRPLSTARVLAWVDDPVALYSMQIQGSGKIRLTSGATIRVGYAEQNGHQFAPALAFLGYGGTQLAGGRKQRALLTRGLGVLAAAEAGGSEPSAADDDDDQDDAEPVTRGIGNRARSSAGVRPVGPAADSPEVQRMIELLKPKQTQATSPPRTEQAAPPGSPPAPVVAGPADRPSPHAKSVPPAPPVAPMANAPAAPPLVIPRPGPSSGVNGDPSFVFFRPIPNNDAGPLGALGVPLTPGRSVAVDPRTTPLGAPVFLSTTQPGRSGALNRLVLAQDTGGAIRGAVRADYFWGFGARAGSSASRMKELGQMWVLLPKALSLSAQGGILTRGSRGGPTADSDCLIADPTFCVEDEDGEELKTVR